MSSIFCITANLIDEYTFPVFFTTNKEKAVKAYEMLQQNDIFNFNFLQFSLEEVNSMNTLEYEVRVILHRLTEFDDLVCGKV